MLKHISFNFQFTDGKTRSFAADLQHGSTMITGRNGRGKSLILEAFSYLLFGAQALRGVAGDYKKIDASCRVTIRGKDYEITRTKTKAEIKLVGHDEPLAAGTTTVNSFIVELMGYDYDVYRISNWCAQGDIQALANMKPTARKEMIDQVAGLNQVDGLIEMVKQEAKVLKSGIAGVESALTLPIAPVKPGIEESVLAERLGGHQAQYNHIQGLLQELSNLQQVVAPVLPTEPLNQVYPPRPYVLEQPDRPEPLPEPEKPEALHSKPAVLEQARAEDVLNRVAELKADLLGLRSNYDNAKKALARDYKLYGYSAEQAEGDLLKVRGTTIHDWKQVHENWQQKLRYDDLMAQGTVNCPNCGHNHAVAHELLHTIDTSKFPNSESLNLLYLNQLLSIIELETQIAEALTALTSKYGNEEQQAAALTQLNSMDTDICRYVTEEAHFQSQLSRYNDQLASLAQRNTERWAHWERECKQTNERNAERLANWERECAAVDERNTMVATQYQNQLKAFNEAMAEYQKTQTRRQELTEKLPELRQEEHELGCEMRELQEIQTDWKVYHQLYKQYEQLKASYDTAMARVDTEREQLADRERALAALVELKTRVKTYLIPSLNRVASFLLSEMTGGEFNSIAIDESFEVYVDGQPLRTMSGSGKDITNLALRIGLGRILTHKVLGMMMLDEIDQGMDAERAAFTWECIEKVTPQIGQVLVVSHKDLHAENRLVVQ